MECLFLHLQIVFRSCTRAVSGMGSFITIDEQFKPEAAMFPGILFF